MTISCVMIGLRGVKWVGVIGGSCSLSQASQIGSCAGYVLLYAIYVCVWVFVLFEGVSVLCSGGRGVEVLMRRDKI